jgi:hypothetical protein
MRLRPVSLLVAAALVGGLISSPPASAASGGPPSTAPTTHDVEFDSASPNPVLSWDALPGAVKYHVQISASSSFGTTVYDSETVGLQVTPDKNLPLQDLFWRVAGESSFGQGPYSPSVQFTTAWSRSPAQIAPEADAVLSFPADPAVFSWQPLSGAKSYELLVDDSPDFIDTPPYTTPNTSFVLPEPQTVGQPFYWKVRGVSATSGLTSDWSPVRSYSFTWPATPSLLRPANGSTVSDPSLAWQPVPGTSQYHLQISSNVDFSNNIVVETLVKGTAYTPDPTLDNGAYYWRVQAVDASTAKHLGPYSATWSFTRPAPRAPAILAPLPPANDPGGTAIVHDTPTFSWTPVDHAAYYDVQVGTDPAFTSPARCTTNHTTLTPIMAGAGVCSGLDNLQWQSGTTYYWRVRGVDAPSGVVGIWSSASAGAFDFVHTGVAPTPEQPETGSTVTTPLLTWDPVDGALKYQVTIYNASHVSVVNAVTFATSYVPTTTLVPGTYTWTVQSVDVTGSVSGIAVDAPVWSFAVVAPTTSNTTPDPTSPASTSVRMPALTWAPVANATRYTIHYAVGGFDRGVLASNLPFAGYTASTAPLPTGTYTWWVDALNSQNTLIGSSASTSSFTIKALARVPMASLATTYQTADDPSAAVSCGGAEVCGDTPTFTWASVPDATSYQVTVATDQDFTTIAHTYTTRFPTFTPRESYLDSQAGDAYYWFVQACANFATPASCSAAADDPVANVGAPSFKKRSRGVVLCPTDTATPSDPVLCPLSQDAPDPDRQLTFSWADYLKDSAEQSTGASAPGTQSAKQYQIQVSTVADFATTIDTATVDGTSYTPSSKTYPVGPLYWRVRAIDNSGNNLTWSDTTLAAKTLPAPVQDVTVDRNTTPPPTPPNVTGVPLLTWQPSDFAASYTVELYKNGDTTFTSQNKVLAATTKFAAYAPTTTLPVGTYAWRVRGLDADGKPGPWYTDAQTRGPERTTFTIVPPYPSLTGPADGTELTSGNVLFTWSAVNQATQYRWQLSTTSGFSSVAASQTTVMTSWSPLTAFADGASYWRVQALDSAGNVLSSSPPRGITKDSAAPTATAITPTASPGVTDPITVTFSEPVRGVTPSSFQVTPAGSSNLAPGVVHASGTTATWTPTAALVPGQTYTVTVTDAITDQFGNALVPRSWTLRAATMVENTSRAFGEHWDRDTAGAASGGSYDASHTTGSTATFAFTGSSVSLVGMVAGSGGNAAVSVDGATRATTVSFYSGRTRYAHTVWTKSGLGNGPHTVTVRVLGTRPTGATDSWVYLDAFKVGSATTEQTSAAVVETFARTRNPNASGGSYDTTTHVTRGDTSSVPSYTLTVRGTSVAIYGVRSKTSGTAVVYIDGKRRATVDLRATSTSYRSFVYSASGLPDRVHRIRIDVLGTATGAASSVGIDYVTVG